MRMRKFATAIAGVATVALLATACSGGSGDDDKSSDKPTASGVSDKVLTVGMPNGPQKENHNPMGPGSSSLSLGYAFVVYESLMQVNEIKPLDAPTPWLAESVEWNDDSTQAVITPREGVKWSDGEPFTAEDIAFSLQIRKDHDEINADFPGQYGDIKVEDGKVVVNFTSGQFVNQVKLYKILIVPKHIWDGQDPVTFSDPKMVGTGPFKLQQFTEQSITMVPNDTYWGTKPLVGKIRYDAYADNAALTTALTTGEAQWGWTFIPDYENVFINQDPEHNAQVAGGGFGVDVLFLNTTKKPFSDVAFRQALNLVVDRADISKTAGYGVWPQLTSITGLPTPTGNDYIAPEYKGKEATVDVDGAKKILKDAGYTWKGEALVDPSGAEVSFELKDPAGWTDYIDALKIVKEGAEKLGAKAEVVTPQADAWMNTMINLGDFDASLHWTDGGFTPWNMYSNMMDGASLLPIGENASWNFGRYDNAEATKALADFKGGKTPEDRQAALNIVQKHFVEDVPGIVIWQRPAIAQYSTINYTGFPTTDDTYSNPQPTGPQAALIVTKLKPNN